MDVEQLKIDVDFMIQALKEAQAAAEEGEVPVGCVIVADEGLSKGTVKGKTSSKRKRGMSYSGESCGRAFLMKDASKSKACRKDSGDFTLSGNSSASERIISPGRIIARAHNLTETLKDPTAHAEMQAITSASAYLGGKYLDKCTLYVTVEPCPMCAAALNWSQIGRVVYGCADPKRGASKFSPNLYHPKTEVTGGILEKECSQVMTDFFSAKRKLK